MERAGMNRMLSWAVVMAVAVNVGYGVFAWSQASAGPGVGPVRVQLKAETLAPLRGDALAKAVNPQSSTSFSCLRLGPLGVKEAPEALALLGAGTRSTLFEAKDVRDVRFGPWPKSDVPELERILAHWRPATVRPCDFKESEEWEKLK